MNKSRILPLLTMGLILTASLAEAYSPGDLMIVGLDSDPNPDGFSFVTWVDLPVNETILFFDAEYDGGGDGTGEGSGGGLYASMLQIVWTNTTGGTVPAGTVIPVTGLTNSAASTTVGSVSGGFALTNGGEQMFIADGSFTASGGDHYFVGDLIFGFDYEGSGSWGQNNESVLPSALNVTGGNLSFAHQDDLEYTGVRTGLPMGSYPAAVMNPSNWGNVGGSGFNTTTFVGSGTPAYAPGDLMFIGWNGNDSDTMSFVTWVVIPNGESFLFFDAEYDGGGDGSGIGGGGGSYAGLQTMTWTNNEGVDLPAGTVVVITGMTNGTSSANVGTTTGGFAITNQGEQMFIAQGGFTGTNFDGDLIFGVDFEGGTAWGESNESELPNVLNVSGGNLSFGDQPAYEYSGARSGSPIEDYAAMALNTSNWQAIASALSEDSFVETVTPPVVVADELGEVNEGLIFHARRMNGAEPILDQAWSLAQGASSGNSDNLNGAACIRLPADFPTGQRVHPSANYYLYFADHSGTYIRMAWSASLEGTWTGYRMDEGTYSSGNRGVLDLGSDGSIDIGNNTVEDHIASPQVLIERDDSDPQNPEFRFVMYYHGKLNDPNNGPQRTFVATSSDGLNFNQPSDPGSRNGQAGHGTRDFSHGDSYFRVFEEGGRYYAFSNTGDLFAIDENSPGDLLSASWSKGPQPFIDETDSRGWSGWIDPPGSPTIGDLRPRHFGVLKRDGILYAFLTNKASSPERIIVSTFDFGDLPSGTNDSWREWKGDFPQQELIRPEEDWEGGDQPLGISRLGSAVDVQQLRDPGILEDLDGRTYMFYSGEGEEAIGLAQLVSRPKVSGPTEVTTGGNHTYTVATDFDVTPSMRKISKTTPVTVEFGAEDGEPQEMIHAGNGLAYEQSSTVNDGVRSYRLAHDASGQSTTLTFPDTYYARPGTTLEFNSRMGNSTTGQFANLQISFDGTTWQTLWIQQGGSQESVFSKTTVGMEGMVGRVFQMRFRYIHETVRNPSFESGISSGRGWFFDQIVATGLEAVTDLSEVAFTGSSFSLDSITALIDPFLTTGTAEEDRFLLSVAGLHAGPGFSETIGYGKPFVIRVRDSYEDFLEEHFTTAEQADPLISGENADPDQDGFVNLVEHGFGTDPNEANIQVIGISNTPGSGPDPSLSFSWNALAGYGYELQMSTTLSGDFTSIPYTETLTPNGNFVDVVIKPDPSLYPLGDRAFFRLSIPTP